MRMIFNIMCLLLLLVVAFGTIFSQSGWVKVESGTISHLRYVRFANINVGMAVGEGGTILRTVNGGVSWISRSAGVTNTLRAVCMINSLTTVVVGNGGTILRTTNGGISWINQVSGTTKVLESVSFSDFLHGMVIGRRGTILRTTNGGTTWEKLPADTTADYWGVSMTDENTAVVVGGSVSYPSSYQVYRRTDDGGVSWRSNIVTGRCTLVVAFFINNNTGWIADCDSIYATTDGGDTWTTVWSPRGDDISFINASTWVTMGYGLINRTTDAGMTWAHQSTGTLWKLRSVSFTTIDTGVAVGDSGLIFRTTNGGITTSVGEYKPFQFTLAQNYPNPFNPTTTIEYSLSQVGRVQLGVYNLLGQLVYTLVDQPVVPPGTYTIDFTSGKLPSGVYFYRLSAGSYLQVKKMVLQR